MTDAVRLLEARIALQAAVDAGLKIVRKGRIQVVGMVPAFRQDDPNVPLVKKLAQYRKEIEHLLPREGDSADQLERPALAGLMVPR